MKADIKILRLGDMIFRRQGSFVRQAVVAAFSVALRLFFRRIEVVNAAAVPQGEPLVFVINHPNGLIDPALVFVALPRKISFLAKSTLFHLPVISFLLKTVEALPLYRRVDAGEDVSKNQQTFEVCRNLLRRGGAIALFPEGVSHNSPRLLPIKTGAARIALGAISVDQRETPLDLRIVPVGLFYTSKTTFRSEALLHFGASFRVLPVTLDADGQPPREAVRELTEKIEAALRSVTINAESEAEMESAEKAEKLFSSVSEGIDLEQSLTERFAFLKSYIGDLSAASESGEQIKKRVAAYESRLREFGIEPENLSLTGHSYWFVFRHFLVKTILIMLFLPVTIAGTILHFPAYQLCKLLAFFYTKHGVDDIVSTVKILAAMLFMPLTWAILAAVLYLGWNWQLALLSIPLAIFSGYVALVSWEETAELRGWFRAVRLFYLKRATFLQLLTERRALHKTLTAESRKRKRET